MTGAFPIQRARGLTLLEMAIASALVSLILGSVLTVLLMGQQSFGVGSHRMVVNMETRRALESMTRELAESRGDPLWVTFPPANGQWYTRVTFAIPQDGDGDGTVFQRGTTQLESPSQWVTYERRGRNQLIRDGGLSQTVLGSQVTSVRFRRPTASTLEMELTALSDDGQRPVSRTTRTRVLLRN